jgi:uncharacterized membrane protein YuzA (DUF378 family)
MDYEYPLRRTLFKAGAAQQTARLNQGRGNVMRSVYWISLVLLVVGGLNWLLVGLFDFDLVAAIFGSMSAASRTVYTLVGIAAIVVLLTSFRLVHSHDHRLETRLPGRA